MNPSTARTTWTAFTVFVLLVVIANVVVEATPRARGIAFVMELRYAVLTPVCALASLGAVFLYRFLRERSARPRAVLAAALAAVAVAMLALMGVAGLAAAAAPVVFSSALALALLVPWQLGRRPRLVGIVATTLFGALELAGMVAALASERPAPAGANGMAFDVPRELFDADHRFVDLPSGARVHYVDEGAGETLLFLHGNPAWSFQWRELIGGLRATHRCVALDYPGFGLSYGPPGFGYTPREQSVVVEELVDHLGLRDVTLVMQDWGGPLGLGLAGRRPELVRRVVLGSTWAWPTRMDEPRGMFSTIVGGPVGEFAQMNFNAFASAALHNGVVRDLPADVADVYLRPFRPVDRRGVAAFYPGQITAATDYFAEVQAGLPRLVNVPALIFWAAKDRGFPRSDLDRLEATFPEHITIELPHADHFFFEDAAEEMLVAIRSFTASRREQAASPLTR